jgi:ribose transport system substrate-binding protein
MKIRSLFPVLVAASFLAGCGDATNPPADGSGGTDRGLIGVSLLTLENPFFKVIGDTISSEGAKHGYETLVVSGDKDVAKQGNQIKDFIVKGAAAIVLSPCDSKSILPSSPWTFHATNPE